MKLIAFVCGVWGALIGMISSMILLVAVLAQGVGAFAATVFGWLGTKLNQFVGYMLNKANPEKLQEFLESLTKNPVND